jgi:hypothetical protein
MIFAASAIVLIIFLWSRKSPEEWGDYVYVDFNVPIFNGWETYDSFSTSRSALDAETTGRRWIQKEIFQSRCPTEHDSNHQLLQSNDLAGHAPILVKKKWVLSVRLEGTVPALTPDSQTNKPESCGNILGPVKRNIFSFAVNENNDGDVDEVTGSHPSTTGEVIECDGHSLEGNHAGKNSSTSDSIEDSVKYEEGADDRISTSDIHHAVTKPSEISLQITLGLLIAVASFLAVFMYKAIMLYKEREGSLDAFELLEMKVVELLNSGAYREASECCHKCIAQIRQSRHHRYLDVVGFKHLLAIAHLSIADECSLESKTDSNKRAETVQHASFAESLLRSVLQEYRCISAEDYLTARVLEDLSEALFLTSGKMHNHEAVDMLSEAYDILEKEEGRKTSARGSSPGALHFDQPPDEPPMRRSESWSLDDIAMYRRKLMLCAKEEAEVAVAGDITVDDSGRYQYDSGVFSSSRTDRYSFAYESDAAKVQQGNDHKLRRSLHCDTNEIRQRGDDESNAMLDDPLFMFGAEVVSSAMAQRSDFDSDTDGDRHAMIVCRREDRKAEPETSSCTPDTAACSVSMTSETDQPN